jgi:hypothetical protein
MRRKQVYRCEASAVGRELFCGKAKANASCLKEGILGGRCSNLVTSYVQVPKTGTPKKTETTHRQPRKVAGLKETEEMEIEQEITRTEKIKTRVRKISIIERRIEGILKGYIPTGRIKSERELELQLAGKLSQALGQEKVETQCRSKYGRVDVVVDKEYAIELKMPSSYSELIRSEGPISHYAEDFKRVFLYVYDEKKILKPMEKEELQKKLPKNVILMVNQ